MSKALNSPTARLVQSSRLFSLPKPLPQPQLETVTASGLIRSSDTATLPFPLYQAIESPTASRASGDWGLKRSLPVRKTNRSNNPSLRILAQDTSDHVTNFESAGDHERSVAKFQEMGIPILRRGGRSDAQRTISNSNPKPTFSVYEDTLDNTDPRGQKGERWKFLGQWIGGMQENDLDVYLQKLRSVQPEWEEFVTNWYANKAFTQLKASQRSEHGFEGPIEAQDPTIKRDHVVPEAQKRTQLLREKLAIRLASLGKKDRHQMTSIEESVNTKCNRIESYAQQQEQQYEAEAKRWVKLDKAITDFRTAEIRARDNIAHAEAKAIANQSVELFEEDAQQKAEGEMARATQDAENIMRTAYEDAVGLLESEFDAGNETSNEARARLLIDNAEAVRMVSLTERVKLRKQWDESTLRRLRPKRSQVRNIIKKLRADHLHDKLSSELTALLSSFLDLPGIAMGDARTAQIKAADRVRGEGFRNLLGKAFLDPSSDESPPSTHPGAGLGYLRSGSYMENHPIYGPQAQRSPVLSRVLRARTSISGTEHHAKVGIGGFVGNDSMGTSWNDARKQRTTSENDPDRMAVALDPTLAGGNKLWMHPNYATVGDDGRVILTSYRGDKEAIAVKVGDVDGLMQAKKAAVSAQSPSSLPARFFGSQSSAGPRNSPRASSSSSPPR